MIPVLQALRLMRIPFSVFLMPVYWFAFSWECNPDPGKSIAVFVILHLLVFPASNGYNSWFDRDEGSIGGLKSPPPVNPWLFRLVLLFDFLAFGLSFLIGWEFALMVIAYTLVSKAYSWDRIRLKKYPVLSTIVVTIFQGGFTFWTVMVGLGNPVTAILDHHAWVLAVGSSLMLNGSYPLTQVFQHEEDRKRGDQTLSLLLGVRGTFLYAISFFIIGFGVMGLGYFLNHSIGVFLVIMVVCQPILFYFMGWWMQVIKDPGKADYDRVMFMNKLSSIVLSLAFLISWFFQCRLGYFG